jgi:rhomboid protease GluP
MTHDELVSDGTRRFEVAFQAPGSSGSPANNQGLSGHGTVDVDPINVTFSERREGDVHKARLFSRTDIVNVEWSDERNVVIVRTRDGERFVAVWLASAEETRALAAALPTEVTPGFIEHRERENRFNTLAATLSPRQLVTPVLVAINVVVFAVMLHAGAGLVDLNPEVHVRFGSNYSPLTWNGEPWRLLTCAFIHFGVIHLAFNMYALWSGGILCEKLYGSARFLAIYLLAALAGSVVSSWWDSMRNSAGASGAVFGVYGALLVFFAVRRSDIPLALLKSAGQGALMLIGYSLFIGATSSAIDNAAHVGGLLGGALTGWLLARPFTAEARAQPQPARVALTAVVVCAALTALSWPLWKPGSERFEAMRVHEAIEAFVKAEKPIVESFSQVIADGEGNRISAEVAAAKVERNILPEWQKATEPVLALPDLEAGETKIAQRLSLLKTYVKARESAMRLTAQAWRGQVAVSEVNQQWQKTIQALEALNKTAED